MIRRIYWVSTVMLALGMVVAGFVPSPLGKVVHYSPTAPEIMISLAIWAIGLLVVAIIIGVCWAFSDRILEFLGAPR